MWVKNYYRIVVVLAVVLVVTTYTLFINSTGLRTIKIYKIIDENKEQQFAILEGSSGNSDPVSPTSVNALNISLKQNRLQLIKLPWTSVCGKGEDDSYHFFSAYFDDRAGAPNRPAVIVLGYTVNGVRNIPLYCNFKYANGRHICLKKPLEKENPIPCHAPSLGAQPYHYYCPVKAGEDPPVSVMISNTSTCDPKFTSNEIPVKNRDSGKGKVLKKFGVCVSRPVIENDNTVQELVEFISMSKLLGAELITFYINKEELNESIIRYILHRYADVRMIEWKHFKEWYPVHFFGQTLIMSDCMYRSMYETEYVLPIDIDEMIVPMKAASWSAMLQDLPQREKYASLVFENIFFHAKNASRPEALPNCGNLKVSKYFTRLDRHTCYPGYQYLAKLMIRPRFVLQAGIHFICSVMSGYQRTLQIPNTVAILAHYRDPIAGDCINNETKVDNSLLKYSDGLRTRMCAGI